MVDCDSAAAVVRLCVLCVSLSVRVVFLMRGRTYALTRRAGGRELNYLKISSIYCMHYMRVRWIESNVNAFIQFRLVIGIFLIGWLKTMKKIA